MNRTWIEINRSALFHNIDQLSDLVKPSDYAAVIKANAYGHGLVETGKLVNEHPAVTALCVAHIAEALSLRAAGINKSLIVVAPFFDTHVDQAIRENIEFTVYNYETLKHLQNQAQTVSKKAKIHIKIDTGMTRLGFQPTEIGAIIDFCTSHCPALEVKGIMTHISDKDNEDSTFTQSQLHQFNQLISNYKQLLLVTHALSSGALECAQNYPHSFARVGTNMYGYWSSAISKERILALQPHFSLQPVLTWKTRIMQIKMIAPGAFVGYACTFQAKKPMTIAVLPIGYWDGYPRALSNKGYVIIKGQRAPILGIVSMNLTVVDISGIPAQVNDEVILLGTEITADQLAAWCNTINIEFTTRINPLIPRIIID